MESEKALCRNCERPMHGEICAHCGQKKASPIEARRVLGDIWSQFLELDFKVARAIKHLVSRPGPMIIDYWKGKRVLYTNPFKLLFFSATGYYIAIKYYDINVGGTDDLSKETSHFIGALLNYLIFVFLIPTAYFFKMLYARNTINWAESYVAVSFIWSGYLMLGIPLAVLVHYSGLNYILLRTIVGLVFIIYCTKNMFELNWLQAIAKSILFYVSYFISTFVVISLAIVVAHLVDYQPLMVRP